jgi:hypothetical protein
MSHGLVQDPTAYVMLDILFVTLKILLVFIIAGLSIRAYLYARDKRYLFLSIAFTLIFVALVLKDLSSYFFVQNILCNGCLGYSQFYAFYYSYMAFYLVGAGTLGLIYLKARNAIVLSFFGLILIMASIISVTSQTAFSSLVALLYGFVTLRSIEHYGVTRNKLTFWTIVAFGSITIGHFLRAIMGQVPIFYPIGEGLTLIGYGILVAVLMKVYS